MKGNSALTDDLIETVARAIAASDGSNPDYPIACHILGHDAPLWHLHKDNARAAIRAIELWEEGFGK